jgi:hypothetical protein
MDRRAVLAREYHRSASAASEEAAEFRAKRDKVVRELYSEGYGYRTLARMVGCSWEMIRLIVKAGSSG